MKITTPEGRTFTFGEAADESYARYLVKELLAAEKRLADAVAADEYGLTMDGLKRGVEFAQMDLASYEETTRAEFRWPSYQTESNDPLSPGERAIIAELREIRRAVMGDRILYADPLTQEMTRSRVVLSKEEA